MPIYVFQCKKCNQEVEVLQGYYDKRPTKHEECGGKLEQRFGVPAKVGDAGGKTVGSVADYNASKMTDDDKARKLKEFETKKTSDLPGYKPDIYKYPKYDPLKKAKKK